MWTPITRQRLREHPHQRQQGGQDRVEPPLQPTRRADADQLPHQQSEIETADVNQQSLQNVRVPAEVHAAHPARFVEMREGPLQALAAKPQQTQAPRAANTATIAIDRGACVGLLLPVASPAIGFRDVAPDAHGFQTDE